MDTKECLAGGACPVLRHPHEISIHVHPWPSQQHILGMREQIISRVLLSRPAITWVHADAAVPPIVYHQSWVLCVAQATLQQSYTARIERSYSKHNAGHTSHFGPPSQAIADTVPLAIHRRMPAPSLAMGWGPLPQPNREVQRGIMQGAEICSVTPSTLIRIP